MFNFRDVGGYPGLDGRTVRWGRLFRSDALHRLDGTDREAFAALGIRTVIDLRRPTRSSGTAGCPTCDGLAYRHIHPEHVDWERGRTSPASSLARWLADRYLNWPRTARRAGRGGRPDRRPAPTRRWWCTAWPARTAPASSAR